MSELNLPLCPICHAQDSLSLETLEKAGRPALEWYECQECGSVLLWMGDDRWAYQKVRREKKQHLLKQPQSEEQLQALLPREEDVFDSRGLGKASSDFVTLSCPSCGGQLEVTSDIDLHWPNILIRSSNRLLSGQSPKGVIDPEWLIVERIYYLAKTATSTGDWTENPMPPATGGWAIGEKTGRLSPHIGRLASQLPVVRG